MLATSQSPSRSSSSRAVQRKTGDAGRATVSAPATPATRSLMGSIGSGRTSGATGFAIQTKVTVGEPHDRYEKEADGTADRIRRGQNAPTISRLVHGSMKRPQAKDREQKDQPPVQRASGGRDEPVQKCSCETDQQPSIQRRSTAAPGRSMEHTAERAIAGKGSGEPLSPGIRRKMERQFGADFGGVRVHSDSRAHGAASGLQARAFTHGRDIWLGRGESQNNAGLMAHELTHVVQQGAAPQTTPGGGSATAPVQRATREEATVQRSWWDDVTGAAGAVWDATGGRLVDAAGNAIEMGADFFWSMLERLAPRLVPILREIADKGIIGFLKDRIAGAFSTIFNRLNNQGGVLGVLVAMFRDLVATGREIVIGLANGDCQPMMAALNRLKEMASQMAGDAWSAITEFFQPVGDFFSELWQSFGAPAVDWLKETAGSVWDFIQNLGAEIWSWTQPVRDALGAAWDWVKEKLGIGAEEGSEGGLIQWVQGKAEEAWNSLKEFLQPVIAPIRAVAAKVAAILPLDAILSLRETIQGWLASANSVANTMDEPEGVADQQATLRETILPAVLSTIRTFRDRLVGAGAWVADQIGGLVGTVRGFMDTIRANSLLNVAAGAVQWLESKAVELGVWAQDVVVRVFQLVGDGLVHLSRFLDPILRLLQTIVSVITDLAGKLPDLILGPLWRMIPACIREPIKNFFIEQILSRIPIFGQLMGIPDLWTRIQTIAMRILRQVFVNGDLLGAAWTFFRTILGVMGLPPELVTNLIRKAATAISDILEDPIGFFGNLLRAVVRGFLGFFENIGRHLLTGLGDWLFGHMREAGITPPADFSLRSILGVVLQILGVTVDRVFARIEAKLGPEKAATLRRAFNVATGAWKWITTLVREGPGGLWRKLSEKLSDLWAIVRDGAIAWIMRVIVAKATIWLAGFLDITGIMPVINTLVAIYNAIQSFFRYLRQMLEILVSVFEGLGAIAKGMISQAAQFVESSLARAIPIALGFLANQFGLGNISEKLQEIIGAIREKVDGAIDWLIDTAVAAGQAIMGAVSSAAGAVRSGAQAVLGWLGLRRSVRVGSEEHTLFVEARGETGDLMIASTRMPLRAFVAQERGKSPAPAGEKLATLDRIDAKAAQIDELKQLGIGQARGTEISNLFAEIAAELPRLGDDQGVPPTRISILEVNTASYSDGSRDFSSTDGKHVKAEPLSFDPGGFAGSEPFATSALWSHVNQRSGAFIRGHLLNHHLFGSGSAENMTPIPRTTNAQMSSQFEEPLKTRVLSQKQVVTYDVDVTYGDRPARRYLASEHRIPTAIHLAAYEMKLRAPDQDRTRPENWEKDASKPIFDRSLPVSLADVPDTNPFGSAPVLKRINLKNWSGVPESTVRRALGAIPGVGDARIEILLRGGWVTWSDLKSQRTSDSGPLLFDDSLIATIQDWQVTQDGGSTGQLVHLTGQTDFRPLA